MGRRRQGSRDSTDWASERTFAEAEADAASADSAADTRCTCGSEDFVLEAYLHVHAGQAELEPMEVGALTCPECGREYEAIPTGNGAVSRGEFRGMAELDGED